MKDKNLVVLLSIFGGLFGIDRFYLKQTKTFYIKLITLGFFGIWYLIDIVMLAIDNKNWFEKTNIKTNSQLKNAFIVVFILYLFLTIFSLIKN